jgi:transposase
MTAYFAPLIAYMQAGVWNARVLLRELRERGYTGGYTLLTDWLRPQRQSAQTNAVRRFETPAGKQAQVDWGHLGTLEVDGQERKLWGFTFTLGHSRAMMSEATLDQNSARCCGCTRKRSGSWAGCRKRFFTTA